MLRPAYETPAQRAQEKKFIEKLSDKWNVSAFKLPLHYSLDYLLIRTSSRKAMAWVELKARKNEMGAYPDYMISFYKILSAKQLSMASGLPSFLAVQWRDCAAALRMDDLEDFLLTTGGRKDRNDNSDIEPVALISLQHFTHKLWEGNYK